MPPLFSHSFRRTISCFTQDPMTSTITTVSRRSSLVLYRAWLPKSAAGVVTTQRSASYEQKAKDLNQKGINEQLSSFDDSIAQAKEKQARTPWHREGTDEPPVKRPRSASAMTKGKHFSKSLPLYFVSHSLCTYQRASSIGLELRYIKICL